MIQVTGTVAADTPNALANTDLASAPGPGVVLLNIASSQADTRITFGAPPTMVSRNITPFTRTNGVPLMSDDSPVMVPVRGGEQLILFIDIITGATVGYVVKFIAQGEV